MREAENIMDVAMLKPDLMGFIFHRPSPRDASKTLLSGLSDTFPAGIRRVGVFVDSDIDTVRRMVLKYSLDLVQLHGKESPETCLEIKNSGVGIIKAFNIRKSDDFSRCMPYVPFTDYFLFDAFTLKHGGSGTKFDWEILEEYRLDHPFFLSGGIGPDDSEKIFRINNPAFYGVDLNSRFEIRPGVKNTGALKNLILEIRNKNILL